MNNIIKSFHYESENVVLTLNIKKRVSSNSNGLIMFIDGGLSSENQYLEIRYDRNSLSENTSLIYRDKIVFWISYNPYKGLRWENYRNETGIAYFESINEMKEQYIKQLDYIPEIANYFYDSLKNAKKIMFLFDTNINELIDEDK